MKDFKKALNEGFEAAKTAAIARQQIAEILQKFKKDVLEGSEGKITIDLLEFEEEQSIAEMLEAGSILGRKSPRKTYHALVASNPLQEKSPQFHLARWKQSPEGYPCTLKFDQQDIQLRDHIALENGLANLLADPRTGEKLYKLMNL